MVCGLFRVLDKDRTNREKNACHHQNRARFKDLVFTRPDSDPNWPKLYIRIREKTTGYLIRVGVDIRADKIEIGRDFSGSTPKRLCLSQWSLVRHFLLK
jgi:hypothetical protein